VIDAIARPHMIDPAQGGGGLMEIGCYPIAASLMALGSEEGLGVAAAGFVKGGVDLGAGITLTRPDGCIASLTYSLQAQTPEETLMVGTEGYIRIHPPAHCPTKITMTKVGGRESSEDSVFEFPLPQPHATARLADGVESASSCAEPYSMFHYPNSMGMVYEADAVMDCIRAGQTESSEFTQEESLRTMDVCDQVRRQIGVKWPNEK